MMDMKDDGTVAIGDLLETIIDYRGKTPPKSKSGIPLISAANVKGGKVVLDDPEFIALPEYQIWTRRGFTQPGDILITTEAPAGEVAPYPADGLYQISRRVMALRPNKSRLDSRYLLYALQWSHVKHRLLSYSRGTTVPRVLKTDITGLHIPLPDVPQQQAVGAILGNLDDKIELNRRMNETLEGMARAIFKSWFVDFDPVRAKLDGRQPTGLDPQTAALFPDSFEHVDGQLVPKGWAKETIKSRSRSIQYGYTTSASDEQVGPHFLRITDIRGGSVSWDSVPYCEIDDSKREKYIIEDGDVFVARTGASTGENVYIVKSA